MAARVLQVPEWRQLGWMRRAERIFKGGSRIVFKLFTTGDVFLGFLQRAREAGMEHIPNPEHDRTLADAMTSDEERLLGGDSTTDTINRPKAHLMELICWLLLDRPRPQ